MGADGIRSCSAGLRSVPCWLRPTTWAASTASSRRSPDTPYPCLPRLLRRRRRLPARRSTSWSSSTGTSSGIARAAEGGVDAIGPERRRVTRSSTPSPRSTPSTSRRSASRTSAATTATSPASSSGGTDSGGNRRRDLPAVDRGARPPRLPHPRAGSGDHRPRRLPTRQHDGQRQRARRRGARLGDLHARRSDGGRRLLQVYWTGPRRRASAWTGSASTARTSRTGRSCSPATPTCPVATSADRLLRRLRLLEAGLHPGGRVRPLPGRREGAVDVAQIDEFRARCTRRRQRRRVRRGWRASRTADRAARRRRSGGGDAARLDRRRGCGGERMAVLEEEPVAWPILRFDPDTFIDFAPAPAL